MAISGSNARASRASFSAAPKDVGTWHALTVAGLGDAVHRCRIGSTRLSQVRRAA